MSPRRSGILLGLVGLALAGFGAASWTLSDRLEQENAFCLGCHLTPEVRLHEAVGRDFEHRPPASLAARHAHAEADFRCIQCHGGTRWPGRIQVKLSAASDAFWYLTGRFEEPQGMAWPLRDEDCRKCHASIEPSRPKDWDAISFHERPVHDQNLGVTCVECHRVHATDVDPEGYFLRADHVRTQCARCHSDFRDEQS